MRGTPQSSCPRRRAVNFTSEAPAAPALHLRPFVGAQHRAGGRRKLVSRAGVAFEVAEGEAMIPCDKLHVFAAGARRAMLLEGEINLYRLHIHYTGVSPRVKINLALIHIHW